MTIMLLEDTPAVLSLGKLCEDHGKTYPWTSGQKPQLIPKWQTNGMQHCELRTSRCSWSIDKLFKLIFTCISYIFIAASRNPAQHPASKGSESVSDGVRGNSSRGPAETENSNKNEPEWPEEFKDNLVDESVPEHRDASSSSHELPSEPRAKVVSGKHSIFHFPMDRNCDICMRTKIYKGSLQKMHWYSRAKSGRFL